MEKIIMHIDVNNAFLSWSAIYLLNHGYKYDIRNTYAIIGGDESKRSGIVLAKSTPAKRKGVVTAETIYSAKKKCPNLNVYPPNFSFYKFESNRFINLIKEYTNDISQMSIDECFIDYSPIKHIYGDEVNFAYKLKNRIYKELGFTVNIGIGNNKLLAKMASDFEKPNKVHTLYSYEVKTKMWPLKIEDLFGIGKKTSQKLRNVGINKIEDLAKYDPYKLSKYFKNNYLNLINLANGIGSDIVKDTYHERDSIGNEMTLIKDVYEKTELYPYLLKLCQSVSNNLKKKNKYAKTLVIVIKTTLFKRISHQKKFTNPTNNYHDMYIKAKEILKEMDIEDGVRLIGVRADNLTENNIYQISLFEKNDDLLEKTIDKINNKYGKNSIFLASDNFDKK